MLDTLSQQPGRSETVTLGSLTNFVSLSFLLLWKMKCVRTKWGRTRSTGHRPRMRASSTSAVVSSDEHKKANNVLRLPCLVPCVLSLRTVWFLSSFPSPLTLAADPPFPLSVPTFLHLLLLKWGWALETTERPWGPGDSAAQRGYLDFSTSGGYHFSRTPNIRQNLGHHSMVSKPLTSGAGN